jgi:hypothetical protein
MKITTHIEIDRHQNLRDAAKAVLRGKFMAIKNAYIKKMMS